MFLSAIALALAAPAPNVTMRPLDSDHIEMAELLLAAHDSNEDGYLDWEEARAMGQATSDESERRGGGAMSQSQIDKGVAFVFRHDSNKDAKMSKAELVDMIAAVPDYKAQYEAEKAGQ